MSKLYTEDMKFSGELFDVLNSKLVIFYDTCRKVGIGPGQYHDAYSLMLRGRASNFYYDHLASKGLTFAEMETRTRSFFETEETSQEYLQLWRQTTLPGIISKYPSKPRSECLQMLFDTLQKVQRGLSAPYQTDRSIRDQVLSACRYVPECNLALYQPADTYEAVCAQLRNSIGTAMRSQEAQQFSAYLAQNVHQNDFNDDPTAQFIDSNPSQYLTDRKYANNRRGYSRRRGRSGFRGRGGFRDPSRKRGPGQDTRIKKCYVCGIEGCWSTKHSQEERSKAYTRFRNSAKDYNSYSLDLEGYQCFLTCYEGVDGIAEPEFDDAEQLLADMHMDDYDDDNEEGQQHNSQFFTSFGEVDATQTLTTLNHQSAFHAITKSDMFNDAKPQEDSLAFTFDDRYLDAKFQGIMPDTGAAGVSTAGAPQVRALQAIEPSIEIDTSTAGQHKIRFGKGEATSLGTVNVLTPFGTIAFQVVPANTPFLLCIADMDKLGLKLDNLENVLIQGKKVVPVVRKWGHPWLLLHQPEQMVAWSHLTETELRQLHRRFGHPSVPRLLRLLQRAGHDVEVEVLEYLTKVCHHCQMHQKSPGRFRFSLKDDTDFNYTIVIDVFFINRKAVLHIVDASTAFQAARFLKDMTAKCAWDTLRLCWIDVYLGPPDVIVHDEGTNFSSIEFRGNARAMSIDIKEVPVEAHNSVGKVEKYHGPLRRAYTIISEEVNDASPDSILQMAVKAVNDTAGPNGIVPTLLVFGAYPRMTNESPPSPPTYKRAEAIRKATRSCAACKLDEWSMTLLA